ncbi:hypothetical protein Anas_05254 [Armadillidium nasatum]|uniref:Uncharacterized protein n=1 Tax=Armadillidium nasatum TaxID=96803 RepID=A0A5N5TP69_9CRUS|nr:hypothetical protein Anas_05254 [Armadillidium nasatum]
MILGIAIIEDSECCCCCCCRSTSSCCPCSSCCISPVNMCKIQGKTVCSCGKLFLGARCPRKSLPVVCDVTGASLPPPLDSSSPVTPDPKAPPSLFPSSLGAADPTTSPGTSSSKNKKCSPFSFENFLKNRSKNWGLKETFLQRKRKGRADEGSRGHDPKALRSTDEVGDREGFISKLGPYGREYLPSITGLLTSPYDSWNVDILRSEEDIGSQHKFEPSATESSCISGEEVSELDDESEEDRDADGSDTEGVAPPLQSSPCPHEERRSSERYFPRSHHSSSGRKTKRKHRKKHFKP